MRRSVARSRRDHPHRCEDFEVRQLHRDRQQGMNVRKPMSNTLETTILLGAMIAMIIGGLANAAVTDFC